MFSNRSLSIAIAVLLFGAFAALPAKAALILTYDTPTISLSPGTHAKIFATLLNSGPDSFHTDEFGFPGPWSGVLYIGRVAGLYATDGTPAYSFRKFATSNSANSKQLYNLDLEPNEFVSLLLGSVSLKSPLADGSYEENFGIYEECWGTCLFIPDIPPNFLDPGNLTINVTGGGTGVPEPPTIALVIAGFAGLGFFYRRNEQSARA